MTKFIVVGNISGENIISDCFVLHNNEKPVVLESLEDTVESLVEALQYDCMDYTIIGHVYEENSVIATTSSNIEIQYKIVALDGSDVKAKELLIKHIC